MDLDGLPEGPILCTVDVVGLYPSIPHEEGLEALKGVLEHREDKTISTATLLELAHVVLKMISTSSLGVQPLVPNALRHMRSFFSSA